MLAAGARLGQYEIVAPLRSGGMATLYVARKRGAAGFDREVAIKVIHPHLAEDAELVAMFLDEARLQAKIHDPHVVNVEELGEDEGRFFIVMELVRGRSVAELLAGLAKQGRRMGPACAVHIAIQLARGLEAAHELGVVHRDVSPQNALLSFRGYVKLIDFGIAKVHGDKRTATGSLRGKISYMSPEQAFGEAIDARTDLYALGVVLWEMLTGRRLFAHESEMALLEMVRKPTVPSPEGVSAELEALLREALSVDREGRIASARELARRLQAVPEAHAVEPAELASLIAAVAPSEENDDDATTRNAQVALDTLSIASGELANRDATSATVLALEQARVSATRWRRRAAGIGIAAAAALGVVLAFTRREPAPVPAEHEPAPAASVPAPPAPAETTLEIVTVPAPSATAAKPRAKPRATTKPKKSVEIINGVPMTTE